MCDCMDTLDAQLKAPQFNTKITRPMMYDGSQPRAIIVTEKNVKMLRKGPVAMFATYCPFCGTKYPEEAEVQANAPGSEMDQ